MHSEEMGRCCSYIKKIIQSVHRLEFKTVSEVESLGLTLLLVANYTE